jgi:hypothetical protein
VGSAVAIRPDAAAAGPAPGDAVAPEQGGGTEPVGTEVHLHQRRHDVASVPHDVQEAGLRKRAGEQVHVEDVRRGLVAVARLAPLAGVPGVEISDRRSHVHRLGFPPELADLAGRDPPLAERRVGDDRLQQGFPVDAVRGLVPVGQSHRERDEVRLGRDGQRGMRIQHRPQHRGAGAHAAQYEREDAGFRAAARCAIPRADLLVVHSPAPGSVNHPLW